jgi:hypothetical protein
VKKLALISLLALALPGTALAKGPSAAVIAGPGITTIRISGTEGSSTPFWRLTEAAGWFEAVYGPARLPKTPPAGELGPRYTITWTVPNSGTLHQDVYPYAKPSPLTYMPPGGKVYGSPVRGGWYAGGTKLAKALAAVGGPAQPPKAPAASTPAAHADSGSGLSAVEVVGIVAGALVLVLALGLGIRAWRRGVPARPAS